MFSLCWLEAKPERLWAKTSAPSENGYVLAGSGSWMGSKPFGFGGYEHSTAKKRRLREASQPRTLLAPAELSGSLVRRPGSDFGPSEHAVVAWGHRRRDQSDSYLLPQMPMLVTARARSPCPRPIRELWGLLPHTEVHFVLPRARWQPLDDPARPGRSPLPTGVPGIEAHHAAGLTRPASRTPSFIS
jgi:hypothetical protein